MHAAPEYSSQDNVIDPRIALWVHGDADAAPSDTTWIQRELKSFSAARVTFTNGGRDGLAT